MADSIPRLVQEGYVFLVRADHVPNLERLLKCRTRTIATYKAMVVAEGNRKNNRIVPPPDAPDRA